MKLSFVSGFMVSLLVWVNLTVAAAELVDSDEVDGEVLYERLAPTPPIAMDPSASTVLITVAATATVTTSPASGGEVPK